MLDLLDWKSRSQVKQRVSELLQVGALDEATTIIKHFVARAEDASLVQAARVAGERADLDWVEVCAEAIEADHRLRALDETGCRLVDLALGSQPESRLNVVRQYYGPARVPVEGSSGKMERRLGAYHGILSGLMRATGLEQLAEVQLRPWPRNREEQQVEERTKMLAGHLLVLRFFEAVQRYAESSSLPVPARLQVGVQRPLGGEDSLTQLEPQLSIEFMCAVRPISAEVEKRLTDRHRMHVAKWHENTDKILQNLRNKFKSDGYTPSFMIPDELGEIKQRLWALEHNFLHLHPLHRLKWRDFEALAVQIRKVRDEAAPALIDPAPYRER